MSFKIGDVCVGYGYRFDVERNGMECVILACLGIDTMYGRHDGQEYTDETYRIRWADGEVCRDQHKFLRRIDPKSDFTAADESLWDLCEWKPPVREKVT